MGQREKISFGKKKIRNLKDKFMQSGFCGTVPVNNKVLSNNSIIIFKQLHIFLSSKQKQRLKNNQIHAE